MLLSFSRFSHRHKSSGDPLGNSTESQIRCFFFFFFFWGRKSTRGGGEGRKECVTEDVILCFVECDLLLH